MLSARYFLFGEVKNTKQDRQVAVVKNCNYRTAICAEQDRRIRGLRIKIFLSEFLVFVIQLVFTARRIEIWTYMHEIV